MQRPPKSLNFQLRYAKMEENDEVSSSTKIFFSHPLFSCFFTLCTLILLYFPYVSFQILISPVLLISSAILISLFRFQSARESNTQSGELACESTNLEEEEESRVSIRDSEWISSETKRDLMDFDTNSNFIGNFVEWNLRAPLEVIHEAYEAEDEEEEVENLSMSVDEPIRFKGIERFPSLSLCYPESDSDSDSASSSDFDLPEMSNWISPEKMSFRWEEDGVGGDGLIEIKLDAYHHHRSHSYKTNKRNQTELDIFHGEEDSLIEIDIFP